MNLGLIILAIVAVFFVEIAKAASHDAIKRCIEQSLEGKKYKTKNTDSPFAMHYGDPAVEVFNVLTSLDIKRLEFSNQCIISMEPENFRQNSENVMHSNSNVTNIGSHFLQLFPDIDAKIRAGIDMGTDEAGWKVTSKDLTFESAEFVTFQSLERKPTEQELYRLLKAEQAKKPFVIGPALSEEEEERLLIERAAKYDPEADIHIIKKLSAIPKNILSVYLQINDRAEFSGGATLVKKYRAAVVPARMGPESDELSESEIDSNGSMESEDVHEYHNALASFIPQELQTRYNAFTSIIARYTLEKKEMLVVLNGSLAGLQDVTQGTFSMVKVDYSIRQ